MWLLVMIELNSRGCSNISYSTCTKREALKRPIPNSMQMGKSFTPSTSNAKIHIELNQNNQSLENPLENEQKDYKNKLWK